MDIKKARYKNSALTPEERARDLLAHMTTDEKLGQLLQMDNTGHSLEELVCDMKVGSVLHIQNETADEAISLVEKTRLQIPLLIADDCIHGHGFSEGATVFPTQLSMACGWNPDALEIAAGITAKEATLTGLRWTFSPVLGVARDLRWGRVGETFGEDPFLNGELGAAMIRGYQGDGLASKSSMLATAKHYAGYSQTQGGRDASEADLTQRNLRAWFLPPFERAAMSGCMSFMTGYQSIDGMPSTANPWLLETVLKEEWGFNGVLVTDYDNVGRMHWEQKICADMKVASALAINSGNDVMMATPGFLQGARDALADGLVDLARIDDIVFRFLVIKFKMGLFDDPCRPNRSEQREVIGCAAHGEANLKIAKESLVLLQNDGILPLGSQQLKRIALVGPNADDPDAMLGDWAGASGQVTWMTKGHPRVCTMTVRDGLLARAPDGVEVNCVPGAEIVKIDRSKYGYFDEGKYNLGDSALAKPDAGQIRAAVEIASQSDVIVAVVGDNFVLAGESCSTATLELQGGQIALLEALAATGTPMVVVLVNTKPLVLPAAIHDAGAIIEAFNPGMKGGEAIAQLLFGDYNPSGKLTISIPYHVGQQPIYYNQVRGQHGDTYADFTQKPHFPFGFGLSYTTFEYDNLQVQTESLAAGAPFRCSVDVCNGGSRDGSEVVQLYVRDLVTSATWTDKELKAFKKVFIRAGETSTVTFEVDSSSFSIVNAKGQRMVEPGDFEVLIGPDSTDSHLLSAPFNIPS